MATCPTDGQARIPTVNLKLIERRRKRLLDAFAANWSPRTLFRGEHISVFSSLVRGAMPGVALSAQVLTETFRLWVGREIGETHLADMALLLAANSEGLSRGTPVREWRMQVAEEWAPAVISRGDLCRIRGELSTQFSFDLLAGTAVGRTAYAQWSWRAASAVAGRLGFSRPRDKHAKFAFNNPMDLIGLRCYVHLTPQRSREQPGFDQVAAPSSVVDWNRDNVLRLRCRVETDCPRGWSHPCHKCAIGYKDCPAAVHRDTYEVGDCPDCKNPDGIFDPERPAEICISCVRKKTFSGGSR